MFNKLYDSLNKFFSSWISISFINKLNINKYKVCIYFETESDWHHMGAICKKLESNNVHVIKLISDLYDSHLNEKNSFYIGYGSARSYLFKNIKIKNFILSLTDINNFHLKKSKYKVHYFYIFHSIVSTHRAYYENAFDNYDTIFCVGQHHIDEIKSRERLLNLKPKNLIKHGYGKIDLLLKKLKNRKLSYKDEIKILFAPTWGDEAITENEIIIIIDALINSPFNIKIMIRLHTMTIWNNPQIIKNIKLKYNDNKNIKIESNLNSLYSFTDSDLMISDWSGAAIEFAFLKKKPVIFIDTLQKTKNLKWDLINDTTFEKEIRNEIGYVIGKNDIKDMGRVLNELISKNKIKKFENLLNKSVFNVGNSTQIAVNEILKHL